METAQRRQREKGRDWAQRARWSPGGREAGIRMGRQTQRQGELRSSRGDGVSEKETDEQRHRDVGVTESRTETQREPKPGSETQVQTRTDRAGTGRPRLIRAPWDESKGSQLRKGCGSQPGEHQQPEARRPGSWSPCSVPTEAIVFIDPGIDQIWETIEKGPLVLSCWLLLPFPACPLHRHLPYQSPVSCWGQ